MVEGGTEGEREGGGREGCLLWGSKVVIPENLQSQVLKELHSSHPGVVRMKGIARAHVW